jgi:hypothetical protein
MPSARLDWVLCPRLPRRRVNGCLPLVITAGVFLRHVAFSDMGPFAAVLDSQSDIDSAGTPDLSWRPVLAHGRATPA